MSTKWSTMCANRSLQDGSHVAGQPAGNKMGAMDRLPFTKATHSVCVLKLPTYLESNSRMVLVGYLLWPRCARSILTVPTHLPVTSSNMPYSLGALTLSSMRRIWISPYCSPQARQSVAILCCAPFRVTCQQRNRGLVGYGL